MLLTELKKVEEIDNRISELHQGLTDLYKQRARLMHIPAVGSHAIARPQRLTAENMALHHYDKLAQQWQKHGVVIPSYQKLQRQLTKAQGVIETMTLIMPELSDKLTILLVPPATNLSLPLSDTQRRAQPFVLAPDYVNESVSLPRGTRKWRVLVVYDQPEGLYMGTPQDIIEDKKYLIGGHDTRQLGILEYAALTLQHSLPIDEKTWTVLLKDMTKGSLVPCATFAGGRYRFDLDEITTVFGDDRFRPAVEV